MSGRCLEELESRNCLAGLLDLEEVLYEMLVLETLTCDFWRKSRTKRSSRDFWRKSRTKRSFWRSETLVLQARCVSF